MTKNLIIGLLAAVIAVGGALAFAQSSPTANIEVRVWEDVNDPERNYISARPEGGSWRTLGTIPIPLTDGVSSSGRFRYGDITLAVPLGPTTNTDVTACDGEVVRTMTALVKSRLITPSTFQYLEWRYWPPVDDVARIRFHSRAQNRIGGWIDHSTEAKLRVSTCEVFDFGSTR